MILVLPFPPSLNRYYLNARRRTKGGKSYSGRMISPEGSTFRLSVASAVRAGHRAPPLMTGRLAIAVLALPPAEMRDGRKNANRRDLDNLFKCLLDALTKARVIKDDALFDDIRMVRGNPLGRGEIHVSISSFKPGEAFEDLARLGINWLNAQRDLLTT